MERHEEEIINRMFMFMIITILFMFVSVILLGSRCIELEKELNKYEQTT